jgi:hypothetical protein
LFSRGVKMTNVEYRKLGGAGESGSSINLPPRFVEKLNWKRGKYIVVELDEQHRQIILRTA